MAKYAQIVGNKVHGIFEYDPLPEFAPNIQMVPVDGITPQPQAGWLYDGSTFSEPPAPPAPDYGTKITKLAMSNRFTEDEEVAIDLASFGETVQAAKLRRLLKKLDQSSYIDLSRQQVIQGVQGLEAMGLIGAGRADEILNTPVEEVEVPS